MLSSVEDHDEFESNDGIDRHVPTEINGEERRDGKFLYDKLNRLHYNRLVAGPSFIKLTSKCENLSHKRKEEYSRTT